MMGLLVCLRSTIDVLLSIFATDASHWISVEPVLHFEF